MKLQPILLNDPRNVFRLGNLQRAAGLIKAQLNRLNADRYGWYIDAGELLFDDGSIHDGFIIRTNHPDTIHEFLFQMLNVDAMGIVIICEKCNRCNPCNHEEKSHG